MYIQNDQSIIAGCFDSPFSKFKKLAAEIGSMKTGLPKFIVKGALSLIQSTILEKAKFNIEELNVLKNINKSTIPCQFITSKKDSFVKAHHTEKIQKNYKGENKIIYFDGDHHEQRPMKIVNDCVDFFEKNLILKQSPSQQSTIGENLQKQVKNGENQQNSSMFSAQQIQKQLLFDQSSQMQGQNNSNTYQCSDQNKMQQLSQQQMQRSRIKSVQAPNFSNNLGQQFERSFSKQDNFMSAQDLKNNQQIPSSLPIIQASTIPTIHHAHSRSSTPNIQINLDRKINPNHSEQKPAPSAPMAPAQISMFDNRPTSRNLEQKINSRIHSLHTSGTNNPNQFNFNQPSLLNVNPSNLQIMQENPIVNIEHITISKLVQAPGSGSNTNSSQHQQKSITVTNQQTVQQQQNISRNSNNVNQIIHARERSNTSFTSAMDFNREQGQFQCFQSNTQKNIYSNTNNQNNQFPSTPLIHNQGENRDISVDYSQKIGNAYASKETTPQTNFNKYQTPNVFNNNIKVFSSPDTFQQQQQVSQQNQQLLQQFQNNHQQQHFVKSQSLNLNDNIVKGTKNIINQGGSQTPQNSISINSNGIQDAQVHTKNGSRTQFENAVSNPQSLDSSVQHSDIQRYRATTLDITQPLHQDQLDEFSISSESNNNIYPNNNFNYKINRPRAQISSNSQQITQQNNKINPSNNEFLQEKANTQPKSNSQIDDELSSNSNIQLNQISGTNGSSTSYSNTSIQNNQVLTQLSNNNKSSINNQNQSIISLTEQQSIFSPRQGNNISINNSIINFNNNLNNNSLIQNNTSIRIGQEMSKECKNNTTKLINPEGDNESIISCDSTILNRSIVINASSQKKPGTMNYTSHSGTTNQMSKSTNNQSQISNSSKKQTGHQNSCTIKNSNSQANMISSKSSHTTSSKNNDNKNSGVKVNNNDNQNICITPRTLQNLNIIHGSSQKLGSNSNTSNQKIKTKQQFSQNNIPVSSFTNNVVQSFGNKNNINVTSNSKSSKNMATLKNVLQNSNVDNKEKQSSAQKSQTNLSNMQQTASAQNSSTMSTGYSCTQTTIPKNGHQKNQSKFDFKNKRSTNNVPVQRVKFNKNENISPFQNEIIPVQFKNMYSNKINLFDFSEKSPSNNQVIESQGNQQQLLKANSNNIYLDNFITTPQLLNQYSDNSMMNKEKYNSNTCKMNETIENSNKIQEYQKQQNLNTTINQSDSDTLKKNRSSTTPTFKPDFIKNLQNTKVIHVLSKNEESSSQYNIQSGLHSYQNHVNNQLSVSNNNKNQNYQTSFNDAQYKVNYGANKNPQQGLANVYINSSNFQKKVN